MRPGRPAPPPTGGRARSGPLKALGSERPSSPSRASPARTRPASGPRSLGSREDRAGAPGPPGLSGGGTGVRGAGAGPGPQEPRLPRRPASAPSSASPVLAHHPLCSPPTSPQPQPHLSRFPAVPGPSPRQRTAQAAHPSPAHRPPRSPRTPPHRGAGRRAGRAARCCRASRSSSGGSASAPAGRPSRSREQPHRTAPTRAAPPARATGGPAPRPAPLQAAVTHVPLPRPRPGRVGPAPTGEGVAPDHACANRPPAGSAAAGPPSLPGSRVRMPSALRPASRLVLAPLRVQEPSTRTLAAQVCTGLPQGLAPRAPGSAPHHAGPQGSRRAGFPRQGAGLTGPAGLDWSGPGGRPRRD